MKETVRATIIFKNPIIDEDPDIDPVVNIWVEDDTIYINNGSFVYKYYKKGIKRIELKYLE